MMTIQIRYFLLTASLFMASCSAVPHVKELKIPILNSAFVGKLINPKKFTAQTQALLEKRELLLDARRNPSEVIITLRKSLHETPSTELRVALVEVCSNSGERAASGNPMEAVGYHLAAAEAALPGALKSGGEDTRDELREMYNFSCGRAAKILFDNRHDWNQTIKVEGPGKVYQLRCRTSGKGFISPDFFDELWAANNLEFNGLDHLKRVIRPGFGEMMVGHRGRTEERLAKEPLLGGPGMSVPVTVTVAAVGKSGVMEMSFYDDLLMDKAQLAGESVELAADFTAPLALLYNYKQKGNIGAKGLLHPERYANRMGLIQFEPFREDQIPLVFVHGLASSPATWGVAVNTLRTDPVLREKYQLLAFYYPTGFPIAYNAEGLRTHLEKFQKFYNPRGNNPYMKNMLIVGHSMGGILSNTQIRASGDTLSKRIFTVPIDEVGGLNAAQKKTLKNRLIYEADPNITRAVFVASPHRGCSIATNGVGNLIKKLIKFPMEIVTAGINIVDTVKSDDLTEFGEDVVTKGTSSIRSLEPNGEIVTAILEQNVRRGVVYHSIIGQANTKDSLEEGSDKVVIYSSSHLDGAASEKVVHATHTTINGNIDAIEEMRRILYLHARLSYTRTPDEKLKAFQPVKPPKKKAVIYGYRNRR